MNIPGKPTTEFHAAGAAAGVAIQCGDAVRAGDVLLAAVKYGPTGAAAGMDPAAWTVAAGTLTSATLDTAGLHVAFLLTR